MKEFIISILDFLGFGKNGIMTADPMMFAGRLNHYCVDYTIKVQHQSDTNVCYMLQKGKEIFYMNFKFDKDSKRISSVEID